MIKDGHKIGICGGTFDPVHNGHLIISEFVMESFELDKVIFIPSGTPPHKKLSDVSGAEDRVNMLHLAVETNPRFEVSCMEVDRSGYTYTIDTLQELRSIYGEEVKLFFITGADVVRDLLTWKNYEKVFKKCDFISVLRPGFKSEVFLEEIKHLKTAFAARIHTIEAPLIEISSTIIREKIKTGKSIKYLVPEAVEKYIHDKGLYV